MDVTVFLYFLVAAAALWGSIETRARRIDRRTARLERKVDLLLEQLGIQDVDPAQDQVSALVRQGKKIQAIKLYRDITGADLVEAKNAVESMEA
ncbi:ribosomal protein L7/L12 [Streptomyces sp. NBC_00268]|uniref:ribosomal protein L7/L12 n=1 Tax=Streptomyces sp. NBC_00268 TaxID=2975695 RepID=UPI00224DFAC0|nr:ribosomal protein L7/L12 [Streptomyces sp. NBC_00268]MCX5187700.1 ribosomal protein L7/L12 [Streptomyces sp. NBC_00268]